MLFPEQDAPLVKAWIVKRLENTSVSPLAVFGHAAALGQRAAMRLTARQPGRVPAGSS